MAYKGPKPGKSPRPEDEEQLLQEFFDFCEQSYADDPKALSIKLPRTEFAAALNRIEKLIKSEATKLTKDKRMQAFLKMAALPPGLVPFLPDEVRVYCLLINALKQWVSSQSLATDGIIFGGNLRKRVRASAKQCVVSGETLTYQAVELHHVVRDGRPPIPLSHKGHSKVDRQFRPELTDEVGCALAKLRKEKNTSWKDVLAAIEHESGFAVGTTSRHTKLGEAVLETTCKSASELLEWAEESGLKETLEER
jgi:hypothetical protein